MNTVVISGFLSSDVTLRKTQSGISVAAFNVAVNRRMSKQAVAAAKSAGNPTADFIPVVAWRYSADYAASYLKKGSFVEVQGRMQVRSYDAQDGSKRYVTEVVADNLESHNVTRRSPAPAAAPAAAPAPAPAPAAAPISDEEIPF